MQAKLQAIPTPPPCQHQHLHPRKPQPFLLFHVTLSILIHHPRLHRTATACLLKIMIKFKIKFEIIFVKLKLKSFRIQENPSDAASSDGQQELRQCLEEAFPSASAALLQSIADAAVAESQDSSSLIVAFIKLTKT